MDHNAVFRFGVAASPGKLYGLGLSLDTLDSLIGGPIRRPFTVVQDNFPGLGDPASFDKLHGLIVTPELLDNGSRGSKCEAQSFVLGREDS